MNKNIYTKYIQTATNWLTAGLILILPFFFLTFTPNFFDFNKQALLVIVTTILVLLWLTRIIISKKITIITSRLALPFIALSLVAILSLFFASINKAESILAPFGVGTIVTLTILFVTLINTLDKKGKKLIQNALVLSGTLLAVQTLYQHLGIAEALSLPQYLQSKSFTPTGLMLTTALYLGALIPVLIIRLIKASHKKHKTEVIIAGLASIIVIIGTGIATYQIISTKSLILPPQNAGWAVAIEAFKNKPFLGVGMENFVNAFSKGRPIGLNQTTFWNVRFILSSNVYFHILTTLGLLGFAAMSWFVIQTFLALKSQKHGTKDYMIALVILFILFALFPPSLLLFFLMTIFTVLADDTKKETILASNASQLALAVIGIPIIIGLATTLYVGSKYYRAEATFKRSITAFNQNNGSKTLKLQLKAIQLNPKRPQYYITHAQTSLLAANAIAQRENLSDQDRATISQLIQEGIQFARQAVVINKTNVLAWENLSRTYRQLINLAEGSDQWAIASYRQTIALDPSNPLLRIDLGGVYFSLKDIDNAIRSFEIATQLKPDNANAHYNLAISYQSDEQYRKAFNETAAVLGLIEDSESNDYKTAQKLLEDLRTKLTELEGEPQGQPETLTTPKPVEPALEEPIELPEEAAPPVEEVVEEPLPTPSPNI